MGHLSNQIIREALQTLGEKMSEVTNPLDPKPTIDRSISASELPLEPLENGGIGVWPYTRYSAPIVQKVKKVPASDKKKIAKYQREGWSLIKGLFKRQGFARTIIILCDEQWRYILSRMLRYNQKNGNGRVIMIPPNAPICEVWALDQPEQTIEELNGTIFLWVKFGKKKKDCK